METIVTLIPCKVTCLVWLLLKTRPAHSFMNAPHLHRHIVRIAIMAIICSFGLVAGVLAAPSDEITRAVSKSGGADVKHATPDQFNKAFAAVLLHVKRDDVPAYVSAAAKLRPDLADRIVVMAIRVARPSGRDADFKKPPCHWVEPIIRAAIEAAPDEKDAIVRAALASDPWAREYILAAAGMPENQRALLRPSVNTILGTINPENIGAGGQGLPASAEQPP
jgi:hypothetical protein